MCRRRRRFLFVILFPASGFTLINASIAYFSLHRGKDRESQLLMDGSQAGYYTRIEDAGWLRHVRLILLAGVVGAEKLHFEGTSVLVHCSDGW